jgi:hypothetical protein
MRFTQQQVDAYNSRRADARPQETAAPSSERKINLDGKPTILEVAGPSALAIMHAVKSKGGHISGVVRGKTNGRWHLCIAWPEPENNTIV